MQLWDWLRPARVNASYAGLMSLHNELFSLKCNAYLLYSNKNGGVNNEVTKVHVNIEVPMHTAVGTACTMLVIVAQQSGALGLSCTTLVDWR